MDIDIGELWSAIRELGDRCTELEQRISDIEIDPCDDVFGSDVVPPEGIYEEDCSLPPHELVGEVTELDDESHHCGLDTDYHGLLHNRPNDSDITREGLMGMELEDESGESCPGDRLHGLDEEPV